MSAFVNPIQRLPGVYHQVESVVRHNHVLPERGRAMAMLPLNWFKPGKVVDIHTREWMSQTALYKVGMMFTPDFEGNLGINALMDGAELGLIFPQNTGGAPAVATLGDITITAKKHGTAGNEITVNFIQQGDMVTVTTFFRGNTQGVQRIANLADLHNGVNPFVDFDFDDSATAPLGEVMLEGGDNGVVPEYSDRMGAYMDAALLEEWDTIAFGVDPRTDSAYLQAVNAFDAWLAQHNQDVQESRHGVYFNETDLSADNYDITNIMQLAHFDGVQLTPAEMVLYETGHHAGAAANYSRTASRQRRLSDVEPRLNIRQQEN